MSNFALRPINIEIRKKLLQKQRAFARYSTDTTVAGIATAPVNDEEMVQFFNRTTWAHLISLSVIKSTDGVSRLAIIGGGELEQDPGSKDVANQPLMRSSFEDIYRPFRDDKSPTLLKPISGIKSVSTRYEGNLKSRRQATIQFTIFSLEDLDRLSKYFFRVGSDVLLEFGWNSDTYDFSNTLGNQIITTYHNEGISSLEGISAIDLLKNNTAKNYEKAILDLKGDYEYVLGSVSNFDYSLRDDGGFDCTIVISTVGMSLLDSKVNREESPSQILQHQLYVAGEKATDKPHTTFYHVIDNLPEIMTYSIIDNFLKTGENTSVSGLQSTGFEEGVIKNYQRIQPINSQGKDPFKPWGGLDNPPPGYIKIDNAFSKWHTETSLSGEVSGLGVLANTIDSFTNIAEALELPKWMLFRDVNTQEVYYYNYYTNETAMREYVPEEQEVSGGTSTGNSRPVLVNRITQIENILSKIDRGIYFGVGGPEDDMGIYEYLNTSFDSSFDIEEAQLNNYIEHVRDIWKENNETFDIVSFLKATRKGKMEILKNLSLKNPDRVFNVDGFIVELGPLDLEKAVHTLVDMSNGKLGDAYIDTGSMKHLESFTVPQPWELDFTEPMSSDAFEEMPDLPPINISPETDEVPPVQEVNVPNPALGGNSDIFQAILDKGESMRERFSGLDAPEEIDKSIESESFRTYGEVYKKEYGGRRNKDETIFISYVQGNTVQAFTGFNWDKPGQFKSLAKTFCDSMFTERGAKKDSTSYKDFEKRPFPNKNDPDYQKNLEAFGKEDADKDIDTFLEGFVGGQLPKTWIRWGWFEDNIISKYLGFESVDTPVTDSSTGKPVSIFKSVEPKVNKETGDIIPGYESNKIMLPVKLLTTDASEIIIPDRCKTLDKLNSTLSLGQNKGGLLLDAKLYGTLGEILENGIGEAGKISPVEVPPHVDPTKESDPQQRIGYIRNLFVEVDVLKEAFLNIGSLRVGIDNFFHIMRRNFGPIHDLEIQPGRDGGMVGIVDNNLLYSLGLYTKPTLTSDVNINQLSTDMKVYEFPAWEKESIVKSQDLKVTIPTSMAITALYAGNEYEANMFNYDKSVGSLKVQKLAKFLKLDEAGKDPRDKSLGNKSNMRPLFESKNLVSSGNGVDERGMIKYQHSGDFYQSLSEVSKTILASKGVDPPSYSNYKSSEVELGGTKRKSVDIWENGESTGFYNPTGRLGDPISYGDDKGTNYRVQMEYDLEFDQFSQVQSNFSALNGLMSLGLIIDGTAGIFPGGSYISKYLPLAFAKRTSGKGKGEYPLLFQATNIEHEISPSGWNTTITGLPRLNNNAFPFHEEDDDTGDEMDEANKSSIVEIESEITDGLSRFLNFFNLNGDFANKSMDDIIGININSVDDGDSDIGSFANFMNLEFDMKQERLIKKADLAISSVKNTLKNSDPGYADYTNFYIALDGKLRTLPARQGGKYEKAVKSVGSNPTVDPPGEQIYNSLEMLLFLQISSVITGITYNTMRFNKLFEGTLQKSVAPPTVSRVFYALGLADIMDWTPSRPKDLMNNSQAKLIGEFLINPDNIGNEEKTTGLKYSTLERLEREAIYTYFGVGNDKRMEKGGVSTETLSWSKDIWGDTGPGSGNSFSTDELINGLIANNVSTISTWDKDPITGSDVDDKHILVGPIYIGITETSVGVEPKDSIWFASKLFDNQYAEFTIAFWNILFAVIFKHELGIDMISSDNGDYRAPNWEALDAKLLELYDTSFQQGTDDAIKKVNIKEIENIKSREIFEHALKCQYLINNSSS